MSILSMTRISSVRAASISMATSRICTCRRADVSDVLVRKCNDVELLSEARRSSRTIVAWTTHVL